MMVTGGRWRMLCWWEGIRAECAVAVLKLTLFMWNVGNGVVGGAQQLWLTSSACLVLGEGDAGVDGDVGGEVKQFCYLRNV